MTGEPEVIAPQQDRVPHVLVVHPGAELYGSDRVMAESVAAFRDRDWRVTVALPADGPLTGELRRLGAEVVRCTTPVLRKALLRPRGLLELAGSVATTGPRAWRLLRRLRPDAVYVSTLTVPLWNVLARLQGRRVLCHVHEAEASTSPLVRRALALPLLLAHRVVVNSRFSRDTVIRAVPRLAARTTVVYNGVRGPATVQPSRERLGERVRLLYLGRLSPRKGPQTAVLALRSLADAGLPARLDLVGSVFPGYEWFERELRETAAAEGVADQVHFHGFQPDVWPHVAAADIVLIPSHLDEPFGNTAVEAVLAGRPVVVSDTSGLREAAEGAAASVPVPPADAAALAAGVTRLVQDWTGVRTQARADADRAAARFAPARYQREIADELAALLPVGPDRTTAGSARPMKESR